MSVIITNVETNVEESSFVPSGTNITYGSEKVEGLPSQFDVSEYNSNSFLNSSHQISTEGSDGTFIDDNDYNFGIIGLPRLGANEDGTNAIGAMVFDTVNNNSNTPTSDTSKLLNKEIAIPKYGKKTFWEFLSRIWDFLKKEDREAWENFWDAIVASEFSMSSKAQDFIDAVDPTRSNVDVFESYLELVVGPIQSIPTNLYPELPTNSFTVRPLGVQLNSPTVDEDTIVRRYDDIRLNPTDYYAIRDIAYGQYVIVTPKDESLPEEIFTIKEMMSSEEPKDTLEYAEYDEIDSKDLDPELNYGAIGITNITLESKSKYKFLFKKSIIATPIQIREYTLDVEGLDGYLIEIDENTSPTVDEMVTMLNADTTTGIATKFSFSAQSIGTYLAPYTVDTRFPIDNTYLEDMRAYTPLEFKNGRYIKPSADVWRCYSTSDSCETELGVPIPGAGRYISDPSAREYIIRVNGDLTKYDNEAITIRLTTAKAYRVSNRVLNIKSLQTTVSGDAEYNLNSDYNFYDHVLEFDDDIFEYDSVKFDTTLYSNESEVISDSIFRLYGGMVGITDWDKFNYDSVTSKAAISSLMQSLQNSSKLSSYANALNNYYGLPIAPGYSKSYGVYESYGYEIIGLNATTNTIIVDKPSDVILSKLISYGTDMITSKGIIVSATSIDYVGGKIVLNDTTGISLGDEIHIGLPNRMALISTTEEVFNPDGSYTPPYIIVSCKSGAEAMQHVIDIYRKQFDDNKFPELVVYGTEDDNLDNVYHVTKAESGLITGGYGNVKLTLYSPHDKSLKPIVNNRYIYNDFISGSKNNIAKGYAHFPWPTHKFLLLWLNEENRFFTAYMDAPIDTIYDHGDDIEQYTALCRNVSVLNSESLPGWFQYDQFRFSNGLDGVSSIVETTSSIDGAEFGTYFPAELK